MRIINLDEFLAMPEGTIFMKYSPQIFGDLQVKDKTLGEDFVCADLLAWPECNNSNEHSDILETALEEGHSFKLDVNCYGRDAFFEKDQLYAVYEKEDIIQLIEKLKESL